MMIKITMTTTQKITRMEVAHRVLHFVLDEFADDFPALEQAEQTISWLRAWGTPIKPCDPQKRSIDALGQRRLHVLAWVIGRPFLPTESGATIASRFNVTKQTVHNDVMELRRVFGATTPRGGRRDCRVPRNVMTLSNRRGRPIAKAPANDCAA